MEPFGIYTLANDAIYDQLVALLNSIDANISPTIPVCVIPFDHRLDRVKAEIDVRPNVTLFEHSASINRWETFARQFANVHPDANLASHPRWYDGSLHRKFAAFDGNFEKFVFFDGDSLAMKPITDVLQKLETYDFVFDDWEHAKPVANAALDMPLIEKTGFLAADDIRSQLHCSSFWGSKRGIFDSNELDDLQERLVNHAEAVWVNGQGWWDDAFLFNYMTLRSGRPMFNFTRSTESQERTGNCANADPFVVVDQVLYNEQGMKPIHRIHYMGYSSTDFARLCRGEDVNIPFKHIFLHYRFASQPDQKPSILQAPSLLTQVNRSLQKKTKSLLSKLG